MFLRATLALVLIAFIEHTKGNNVLNVTGIRLIGGSGPFEGRVEVNVNGIWGTICSNSFDMNDAKVLCRTMGLSATTYFSGASFGQAVGPIFAQELRCNGLESHVRQCPYLPNVHCTHSQDIALICTECGSITVKNGSPKSVSSDGKVLTASCNSGYTADTNTSTCDTNGTWSLKTITCSEIGYPLNVSDIRLANGIGVHDGRVELLVNGVWGTMCSLYNFYSSEARALCSILGFSGMHAYFTRSSPFGYGSDPIYLSGLDCKGTETHIDNCSYNVNVASSCYHYYDTAVICRYELNVTDIRLVDGTGPYDGRVEVLMNDTWGTICNRYINENDGSTLCKMLGLNYTAFFNNAKYGSGSGPIYVDNLGCSSSHDHINKCSFSPPDRRYCNHQKDLSLVCTECGQPDLTNAMVSSFNGTVLTAKCHYGYMPGTLTLECLENGTWQGETTCKLPYEFPLNITDARLVDDDNQYSGTVQVKVNDQWGYICSTGFGQISGRIICSMLGLRFQSSSSRYTSRLTPEYIDKLQCNDSESIINDCKYEIPLSCSSPNRYATVQCKDCGTPKVINALITSYNSTDGTAQCYTGYEPDTVALHCLENATWSADTKCTLPEEYPLNITDLRLVNGYDSYEGSVQLKVNNRWGYVCSSNFDDSAAKVVCSMLGYQLKRRISKRYFRSNVPEYAHNIKCNGSESHINDCSYDIPYSCSFTNTYVYYASVECTAYPLNISGIRLAGTPGPYHGRVEIEVNDTWGTICDTIFGSNEATVICRMLGLERYAHYSNARYGEGSGPVYISKLRCAIPYKHLDNCTYITEHSCQHRDDASVLCYGPKLNVTDARLANGTGPYDGRAEIKVNGTWGTICDNNFNINDANTFCDMLGLKAVQYFTGAKYGQGNGPVHVDELFCSSYHSDLSDCRYLYRNSCKHERDISVVCNECGQPDIYYWDVGYFNYNGTTLFADCSYYKTYIGTLQMTCDNNTQTWTTEGQCMEYSFPLGIQDIRLTGDDSPSKGRVELKVMETWGTVCDHHFGIEEANTICSMIGYAPAFEVYSGAYYGEGKGPIFVDDLNCLPTATHLNNCTYVTYDNCKHSNDVSVVCTDCGNPTPINGRANSSDSTYGSVVEVTCNDGYMLVGDEVISCQLSNNWTDIPSCKLIDCRSPVPENGKVNSTDTTNGSVVMVTCDIGYNLSGSSVVTCQSNETWTNYPKCNIVDCGMPVPKNADVTLSENKTTYEEIAVISCNKGYRPDGSSTVSCLANGTWESWPSCEILDCGDPTPNNGKRNSTDTFYGSVVSITCDHGLNITGNSTIVCQADGTWSDNPVCDDTDCGLLSVSNGQVNTSAGTTVGSLVYVTCNRGYTLQGSPTIACLIDGWNASVSCEKQDCGDPTPENGERTDDGGTDFGSTATIKCDTGHELIGDGTITCDDGGVWSKSPKCNIRDCGKPSDLPDNSKWDDSDGTKYGASIHFDCDKGFLLVGNKSIACESNGEWSSPPPSCVEKANISESCLSSDYCHTDKALCINQICACASGIHDQTSDQCDIMPLLPYGPDQNDVKVQNGITCGDKITFSPGIPLYDKVHKDLYVCSNGLISFDMKYSNPTPPQNRESVSDLNNRTIVAPFYAPIDVSLGDVFYRVYDIHANYKRMKEDRESESSLIVFLENVVKKFSETDKFEASFVLIATWESVKTSNIDYDKSKSSTFQAVIISDGTVTFAFFIYGHDLMQWAHKGAGNPAIWVGFTTNQTEQYIHPFSFSYSVLGLDKVVQSLPQSFDAVTGLIFKPLSSVIDSNPNYAVECITWYNKNLEEKQKNDIVASWLPDCPCDVWLSRFDPWFWNIRRWIKDPYTCVDMFPGQIYKPYGKSCCYDTKTWLWTDRRPVAGSFNRYHPKHYVEHYVNDEHPKEICCNRSNYCHLFYDLRPSGACYRQSPYDFGMFWGDPHFRTLDGLNFTFNGLGEYTLLNVRTENISFDLQARTERAKKKDGSLSDATVFSAFSAKDSSGASFHVEMNKAKNGLSLYGNNIDLTDQYNNHNDVDNPYSYTTEDDNLVISKRDETLSVLFPQSGISLNISARVEMLSLNTIVPQTLRNLTTGLLGNYDGISSNDFMMPNGTVLFSNLSEREVFSYGKTWTININDSAFVYDEGKTHSDYHNESYVPRFLDEVDIDKRLEAEKACNGSQNIECIFDLVFTEKSEIAEEANRIKGQADSTRVELDEKVPQLIGCSSVNVTRGGNVNCQVELDEGTDLYFVDNDVDAEIDFETSTVSFTQLNDNPSLVRISAKNAKDRSSPSFVVSIVLCTGCSGQGYCTDEIREDPRETDYFKYATCVCNEGYEGLDCEREFDACSENPCSLGRNCTNVSIKEKRKGYICGDCPSGYYSTDNNNKECIDIDECSSTNICEHNCTNTDGSYQCSCNVGFRVDTRNISRCRDINECEEPIHNCTQVCKNTNGGFFCECLPGYSFNPSLWTCELNETEASCTSEEKNKCNNTAGCFKDNEGMRCFCESGFELDETGKVCKDVDECKRSVCPQNCTNTFGGFECKCFIGYELHGKTTCKRCDAHEWGENCNNRCECTGQGADYCDPAKGCICSPGWTGKTCNTDIDECKSIVGDICKDSRKECVNNLGSYRCNCLQGFIESSDGSCKDFDECLSPVTNQCMQSCSNTIGGYTCGCHKGFTRINDTHCTDIDECSLGTAGCEQVCKNTPGHYNCYCYYGSTLDDDRKSCIKLTDPCKSLNNLDCAHFCYVKDESASCRCRPGYTLGQDKQSCADVNECEDRVLNQCSADSECMNTDGSFICQCPIGTKLENDGRTCTDCDDFHYGLNCSRSCSCLHGECDKKDGCICKHGWHGPTCENDIDECANKSVVCEVDNSECVNTAGSAVCSCISGYHNLSGHCQDIDECSKETLNTCDQICVNNDGSYRCECQTGFVYRDGKCQDINECQLGDTCEQICENTVGSYRCLCEPGFSLDLTDRKTCIVNNKCTNGTDICGDYSTCFNESGVTNCICDKGFAKKSTSSKVMCEDIDECEKENGKCAQHCNNTIGGYECTCDVGYVLMTDLITCRACNDGQFGRGCSYNCTCEMSHTQSCDNIDGTCTCQQGWKGKNCIEDVDECKSNNYKCPDNASCINNLGSYSCECNSGFIEAYNKSCVDIDECNADPCTLDVCENTAGSYKCKCNVGYEEKEDKCSSCNDNTFGESCSESCVCNKEHSVNKYQTCETATGKCLCLPEWHGDTCDDDVDECKDDSMCKQHNNTVCNNNAGGYSCDCIKGYKEYSDKICIKESPIMISLSLKMSTPSGITEDQVKDDVKASLFTFYRYYTTVAIDIIITDIGTDSRVRRSTGTSWNVQYTIIYTEYDMEVASALTVANIDLSLGVTITISGHQVRANAENLRDKEPCIVYKETVGECADGFECVLENNRPICRPEDTELNLAVIIGVPSGVVILLLTIVIVILCLRQRNLKKKDESKMLKELTSASEMGKKLETGNTRQQNIYNIMNWQTDAPNGNRTDEEAKYMTWKSIASRYTMSSGNDSKTSQGFHIPRARMQPSPYSDPEYITPREYRSDL